MTETDRALLEELERRPEPDAIPTEVDARGTFCPIPLVRLGEAMRDRPESEWFLLHATDPGTGPDLLRWCRGWGYELTAWRRSAAEQGNGTFRFWVRRPRR